MKSVSELKNPKIKYWLDRYGTIFIFSSFGLITTTLGLWKRKSLPLTGSLMLFVATTFFRDFVNEWTTIPICNILFFTSIGLTILSLGWIAYLHNESLKDEWITLAMLIWFILWGSFSRGGKRYDFFIGVPFAFFTAELITFIANSFCESVKQNRQTILKTGVTVFILVMIMFVPIFSSSTKYTLYAATEMHRAIPGNNLIAAYRWIKKNSHPTAFSQQNGIMAYS